MTRQEQINALEAEWASNARWTDVERGYSAADVVRLRGSRQPELTYASFGAERLWNLVRGQAKKGYINCLGAVTGGQAVQQAKAGIEAIYVSGWQVAGDMNAAMQTYPDQSLYPADSVPKLVQRLNNALQRADQITHAEGDDSTHWLAPIVADLLPGRNGIRRSPVATDSEKKRRQKRQ